MTTNEIEKHLISKSCKEINEHAELIVREMQDFGKINTNYNKSGMQWYAKIRKPVKKYTTSPEPEDPWNHFDWDELKLLIVRNMKASFLEQMVEQKTKQLLSKIDLFE